MNILKKILSKAHLDFLQKIAFTEITPGRFFQKEKIDLGNGYKQFFVVLGPNVESPVHNHKGQNMEETHLLFYGSGKFIVYGEEIEEVNLEMSKFHKIFNTKDKTPDHKYIAGPQGSITLALEKYY